jgi:hypothetical protein
LYENSVRALQKLLEITPTEDEKISRSQTPCKISQLPSEITYFSNGIKYYCVEVTCDDGKQFAIQGYGDEAQELFVEAHRCMLCGSFTGQKKKELTKEIVNDGQIVLVDNNCRGLLRKIESVYGTTFFKRR